MKTPVTRERLSQHFAYSWWKYALSAIIIVFSMNMFFTVTRYRPPQEKIVDVFVYGFSYDDSMQRYLDNIRQTEMSDMEQMDLMVTQPDEQYGSMILATRIAASEGDIYILPKDVFQGYAGEGAFVPLDEVNGVVEAADANGINYERGIRRNNETGERRLYGLPLSAFPELSKMVLCQGEGWVCISAGNQNEENTEKLFNILIRDFMKPAETKEEAK